MSKSTHISQRRACCDTATSPGLAAQMRLSCLSLQACNIKAEQGCDRLRILVSCLHESSPARSWMPDTCCSFHDIPAADSSAKNDKLLVWRIPVTALPLMSRPIKATGMQAACNQTQLMLNAGRHQVCFNAAGLDGLQAGHRHQYLGCCSRLCTAQLAKGNPSIHITRQNQPRLHRCLLVIIDNAEAQHTTFTV